MAQDIQYQAEKMANSTKEFLNSNTLISHIVFLVLVIIGFVLLLRLGTAILTYFFAPKPNIVVVEKMIPGNKQLQFSSDPRVKGSVPIMRSRDQLQGIAFTWSTWIFIDSGQLNNNDKFRHVFNKGNNNVGVDGIMNPNNGPGLYISPNNIPTVSEISLLVRMNTFTNETNSMSQANKACIDSASSNNTHALDDCKSEFPYLNAGYIGPNPALAPSIFDDIEIPEMPINKWVSVIIRCSDNNIIDVYINGRLVKRHKLSGLARQNYGDTNVAFNGGFGGFLSQLRYFNYAIGTAEIDGIVSNGPNLQADSNELAASKPYYLADRWYYNEMDPLYSF